MLFDVCVKPLHDGDWSQVEADSPTEAAEEHVRDLCLYDPELYSVFSCNGELVTVGHEDGEYEVRVIVDLDPVFWSSVEK
jgi:hypothetical protein